MTRPRIPGESHGLCVGTFMLDLFAPTCEVQEPIDGAKAFHCQLHWNVVIGPAVRLGAVFRFRLFAEAIGASFSCVIGEGYVAAEPERLDYVVTVLVPPGTLPGSDDNPGHSGLYRIIGVLQIQDSAGRPLGGIEANAVSHLLVR